MTEPINAAQAAQLTAQSYQDQATRDRHAVQRGLDYAYDKIREQASSPRGRTSTQLDFSRRRFSPDQMDSISRELKGAGYTVLAHPNRPHILDVSWHGAGTRGPGLPGQHHLTE
ncbi:hypothetical protein [Deinococcus aquaticus]|uniref:Uncharacterized protein n=1 Tax=Deinococcus aquaticus TaxID=328692 RepID=A0ABY7V630_9DEIO|nr:hypothetical protein [Deinococcus aquaticus]WDA60659.1 hypothetical protein M8445_16970 [Deinococcus aquaticus]